MITDSAQHHPEPAAIGLMARVGEQVRQLICALHGHDSLLHFEQGRMSLLCSSCGYETPGWDVQGASARREIAPAPRRISRMPFVDERRVA
jgi:hypothetical protein